MKRFFPSPSGGNTLIVTLTTVAALSFLAAHTLTRAAPRVRMAYQNAAWQEARVAAEAGIDCAMNDLLVNTTGFTPGAWAGGNRSLPRQLPPQAAFSALSWAA